MGGGGRRGGVRISWLHKHPHSRGRVLRYIGEDCRSAAHITGVAFLADYRSDFGSNEGR